MTGRIPAPVIEKTMSASTADFHRAMKVIKADAPPALHHVIPLASGTVTITYQALPDVTLGTHLSLPQARVSLSFSNATDEARKAFLHRFDLAFQRGGG